MKHVGVRSDPKDIASQEQLSGGDFKADGSVQMTGALNEAKIVNVSAAATMNFATWASNTVAVAGSGTINTLSGGQLGCVRRMRFTQDGIVLGHLTGNINLPGAANITVKVNDVAEFVSLTNGQWLCFNYTRADGTALVSSSSGPATTDALPEGTTNLYFTAARVLATTLAGFASAVGAVTAADTILAALGKLQGTKVDKVDGKGLSTNDYTTAEQTKLAGIATGAQVNTVTSVATRTGDVVLTSSDVGLDQVNNTSDANKPVSTAQQTALNLKAPIANPVLTGTLALNETTTDSMFRIGGSFPSFTGANGQLFNLAVTFNSATQTGLRGNNCYVNLGSATNLSELDFFRAAVGTNTGVTQYAIGMMIDASCAIGTVSNRGYQSAIPSGSNNFNLYMSGSAGNYLNGDLRVGTPTQNSADKLTVAGSASIAAPLKLGQYTLTTLPSAATYSGYEIDVTNAVGGPQRMRSNGTSWLTLNAGGWSTLTLASGYTAGTPAPQYRIVGDEVQLRGRLTQTALSMGNVENTFATLPTGYRPAVIQAWPLMTTGTTVPTEPYVIAATTGVLTVGAKMGIAAAQVLDLSTIRFSLTA